MVHVSLTVYMGSSPRPYRQKCHLRSRAGEKPRDASITWDMICALHRLFWGCEGVSSKSENIVRINSQYHLKSLASKSSGDFRRLKGTISMVMFLVVTWFLAKMANKKVENGDMTCSPWEDWRSEEISVFSRRVSQATQWKFDRQLGFWFCPMVGPREALSNSTFFLWDQTLCKYMLILKGICSCRLIVHGLGWSYLVIYHDPHVFQDFLLCKILL